MFLDYWLSSLIDSYYVINNGYEHDSRVKAFLVNL